MFAICIWYGCPTRHDSPFYVSVRSLCHLIVYVFCKFPIFLFCSKYHITSMIFCYNAGCCQFCFRGFYNERAQAMEWIIRGGRLKEEATTILFPLNIKFVCTYYEAHRWISLDIKPRETPVGSSKKFHRKHVKQYECTRHPLRYQVLWDLVMNWVI